jgi:UDP-2,3-diacylglucosamine pyrophosphatase LpxH
VTLYAISDLHLDECAEARLFDDARQGRQLKELCDRVVNDEGSELILLGDCFDFTAMQPPPKGLERFFARLEVPQEPPARRALPALLDAVQKRNPVGFEALAQLSQRTQLTVVPGNHDYLLAEPEAGQLLAARGIRARIERSCVRRIGGRTVVLQHGHELDGGNEKPGCRGEVMTNALHQAVIPWLRHKGAPPGVRMDPDRVVALRPEEAVVSVLQRWTDEDQFRRFFRAFLRLLAENGYLPRPVSFLAGFVSANRVRSAVASADRLWERTAVHALEAVKGKRALPHGAPRPDALVLGHTHVIDWAVAEGRLYANLGTWTERAFDASSPKDRSMPLLQLDAPDGALRVVLSDLACAGEVLQRYQERDTTRLGPGAAGKHS